ncbi:phospholipase A and acyltransferase 3-like [Brienomyrus brachyistius]|uniref:phospholipase A and acyltransferase 3-like n=1 Tax=Brienomyrus brachyistius TaxID=42636 RepID=UPI0020B18A77|nr:phospholipase A and acyltransferase 3-like [Brienomyrus brachyistius]
MAQRMDHVEPKPGDLIEISRGIYQHWATYVGNDNVIHLTTPNEAGSNSTMSVLNDKGIVKMEKLSDVAGGNEYRINNRMDDKYEPKSGSNIVNDAQSLVGQKVPYSVINSNCEHFATGMRYDKPESQQVRGAVQTAAGVGAAAIGVGLLAAGASAMFGSRAKERRNSQ